MADGSTMARRGFIGAAAAAVAASGAVARPRMPVLDTHMHLFDPRRPQGAPYTGPRGQPPIVALPEVYRRLAAPAGIAAAIVVETSPWVEDNLWLLERAQSDPMFVGVVGNLQPDHPEFAAYLERFAKDPLWRGLRYARPWTTEGGRQAISPSMTEGLRRLGAADLTFDMYNPTFEVLSAARLVSDAAPDLRVVIDHLPLLDPTPETQAAYDRIVGELAQRPNIFVKLSAVIHRDRQGAIAKDPQTHRARLDRLTSAFGDDRVMFGSDWPNSVGVATIPETLAVVRSYFTTKTLISAEKYFFQNALRIYKCKIRNNSSSYY